MSELTKIAAILFKNLSDALLLSASEISKLDGCENTPKTFTQANDKPPLLEPEKPKLITHYQYNAREKVLCLLGGSQIPTKCKVVKRIDADNYLVCPQRSPKAMETQIKATQILGLDPDR